MSRGYCEGDGDEDNPVYLIAHTWVERAIKGKRGQSLLQSRGNVTTNDSRPPSDDALRAARAEGWDACRDWILAWAHLPDVEKRALHKALRSGAEYFNDSANGGGA